MQSQIHEGEQQLYPQLSSTSLVLSAISEREDSSAEEKEKQQFLREQIMEYFGEDAQIIELFATQLLKYINEKKGYEIKEVDLNLITIQELNEMVLAFKERIRGIQQANNEEMFFRSGRSSLRAKSIIIDELESHEQEKLFYKNGAWDYLFQLSDITCNKVKPFFNDANNKIIVSIINSQVRKDTKFLMKKNSLWIQINSKFLSKDVTVSRSIEDFLFLREVLQRIHPHSFVPMLEISKQELEEIEMEWMRVKITKKCERFIQKIVGSEELLENVYTFRFLAELKEANYIQHRKDNEGFLVRNAEEYKNVSGILPSELTEGKEKEKVSIDKVSGVFNDKSKRISNLSVQIGQQTRTLQKLLAELIGQLNSINQTTVKQQNNLSYKCDSFTSFITSYREVVAITANILHSCEQSLLKIKDAFVNKSVARWNHFNLYKDRLMKEGEAYQRKRKEYLQNECMRVQGLVGQPNAKVDLKIGLLNLSKNAVQHSWIQRETFWYGNLNTSLVSTFNKFLHSQQQDLVSSLKATITQLSRQLLKNSESMLVLPGA